MFERNVFYECSEYSGLEVAKFEDTLATLPSSALQPKPLPSILKTIKGKKNTSRRVSVGVPVYYDYFSRYNNHLSKCIAQEETEYVESQAVALKKSVIRFSGKQVLPVYLEQLFTYCFGVSFVSTATLEDLDVFTNACVEYKNEMKHAATTIQLAFRVPKSAATAKLSLWKRLYQEKIKTTATEEMISVDEKKKIKSEAKPVTVVSKYRVFKPSVDSKKNRADRQSTLSNMRKTKKAANLARRRGLATVIPAVQQAHVQALIPSAPSAPIKKKRDSFDTYKLSRPINLEHAFELVRMISILSKCALTSIIEVDEPIEFTSILPKCKLDPIKEVQEPVDLEAAAATTIQALIRGALTRSTREAPKVEAITTTEPEEIKVDATTSSDRTTELGQILPVEQEPEVEATTTDLWDDEFSQPHSAEADVDIVFEQADEPLLDLDAIPEATPEPIQSPKKRRRCKAVESSLDGNYWSVSSSRRRRKSSRVRRQPDFFTPS